MSALLGKLKNLLTRPSLTGLDDAARKASQTAPVDGAVLASYSNVLLIGFD
jgi:hypothetical protein